MGGTRLETIEAFLSSNGIQESDLILDGTFKELKTKSGFKGWYVGDKIGDGKRTITIEDWRTRDRKTFIEGLDLTDPNEREKLEEVRLRYEKEKRDLQLLKKGFSQQDIEDFKNESWTTPSKYLTAKKIEHTYGAILCQSRVEVTDLIIPMQDKHGEIWNYQKIQDSGAKAFVPGALVDGLYFVLNGQGPENPDEILITEGFATACSVKMACSSRLVVCAFSANNLLAVAEVMRELHPKAKILIAGDDDYKKDPNTGREKAEAAAKAVLGGMALPVFPKVRGANDSDFNDLHQRYDLTLVKKQIEAALTNTPLPNEAWSNSFAEAKKQEALPTKQAAKAASAHKQKAGALNSIDPYINGVAPIDNGTNKQGQPIPPTEFQVANALFLYYEGRTVVSEESVFIYDQTHWKEVDNFNKGKIMIQIQVLFGGKASTSKLKAAYEQFTYLLPKAGRNLFKPNPYVVNFPNGTIHVEKIGGKWGYRFAAHNKEDYCTHVIPINFDETRSIRNLEFESMLERILHKSLDKEDKLKAIKQMYGACIAPIFPHLFMFWGPGGTGKSSLIIPAMRLVHEDNRSMVEPHEFKGFTMESMAGKLVNVVLDINTQLPIDDAALKKIEDRESIRIDRKFKNAILAPLPSVHVFGGNEIPATYEKGSGAHTRRWTFLHIEGFQASGNYSKNFANDVFDANPVGVLNFALNGLLEVLEANGHYHVPVSGAEKMVEWQREHDPVALFAFEIEQGDVFELKSSPEGHVSRLAVWNTFVRWYEASYNKKPRIGRNKFYAAFLKQKFGAVSVGLTVYAGVRSFTGLCATGEVSEDKKY